MPRTIKFCQCPLQYSQTHPASLLHHRSPPGYCSLPGALRSSRRLSKNSHHHLAKPAVVNIAQDPCRERRPVQFKGALVTGSSVIQFSL